MVDSKSPTINLSHRHDIVQDLTELLAMTQRRCASEMYIGVNRVRPPLSIGYHQRWTNTNDLLCTLHRGSIIIDPLWYDSSGGREGLGVGYVL